MRGTPLPPPYGQARRGRTEATLTGVGVTLLLVAPLVLALLVFFTAPKAYHVLLSTIGSSVQELHLLMLVISLRVVLLFGTVVAEVFFALLLSRTRRPGRALLIEGILAFAAVGLLCAMVSIQVGQAMSGMVGALGALGKTPLRPP